MADAVACGDIRRVERVCEESKDGSEPAGKGAQGCVDRRGGNDSNGGSGAAPAGNHQDESDEEGEVKEVAGMPRDLREVLRGKRGLDKERRRNQNQPKVFEGQSLEIARVNSRDHLSGISSPRSDGGSGPRRERPDGPRGGGITRDSMGGDGLRGRRVPSPPFRSNRDVPPVLIAARRSSPPLSLTRRGLMQERGAGFGSLAARSRSRERERRSPTSPRVFRRGDKGGGFSPEPLRLPRNCVLHVMNLPQGISLDRVRAELHHECERFGRVVDVKMCFQGTEREAYVTFSDSASTEAARRGMHRFVLLNTTIEAETETERNMIPMVGRGASPPPIRRHPQPDRYDMPPGGAKRRPSELFEDMERRGRPPHDDWDGQKGRREFDDNMHQGGGRRPSDAFMDVRRRPPEQAFDDMHDPSATCRVCVDDLNEDMAESDVLSAMKPFGFIESVEVQRFRARAMAFIKFRALSSAVRARREMDGQRLGDRRVKVEYAMGKPSPQIWVGSVHAMVNEAEIVHQFSRFGRVVEVTMNRQGKCAYVLFDGIEEAEAAARDMRGRVLAPSSWRIKIDFADGRSEGKGNKIPGVGARAPPPLRVASLPRRVSRSPPPVGRGGSPPQQSEAPTRLTLLLDRDVSNKALHHHFVRYGRIVDIERDPVGQRAAIYFVRKEAAQDAASDPEGPRMGAALGVIDVELDRDVAVSALPAAGQKRRRDEERGWEEKRDVGVSFDKRQHVAGGYAPQANGTYPSPIGDVVMVGPYDAMSMQQPISGVYDVTIPEMAAASPAQAIAPASTIALDQFASPPTLSQRLQGRFPTLWQGSLVLKNSSAGMNLLRISGEASLDATLPANEVAITQRMRLEADKIIQFSARLKQQADKSVLLAVAKDGGDAFQTHFVSYLSERNAAGVVQTPTGYMLYLFPPGEIALRFMREVCAGLDTDMLQEEGYLLAVLISAA